MAVLPTSPLTSTFRNPSPTDTRTYGYLGVAGVTLGPGETWVGYGDPIAVVSRPGGSRGRTQREAFIANYGDGLIEIAATQTPVALAAPTVTPPANQTADNSGAVIGPLAFTVSDSPTAASRLVVTGKSSNQTLLPDAKITFGGSGASRTVTIDPNAGTGTATITITATDPDGQTGTGTFTLTAS